ncbi:MAG: Ig-like domain-containing protein [Candidatus Thermoplasmatota archaeon]|nr:Ig-like domain-containing protein [Candidatus Thermoplasmatota archaeon]
MNKGTIALVALLIAMPFLNSAQGQAGIVLIIVSPERDSVISGEAPFGIAYDNPMGSNLSISLLISEDPLSEDWGIIGASTTTSTSGTIDISFDTTAVRNGQYHFRARADHSTGHVTSDVYGPVTVFNPQYPFIKWISPATGNTITGNFTLKANITGDHGGFASTPMFLYSRDPADGWTLIGQGCLVENSTVWTCIWRTWGIPDGAIYLKANATSAHGLYSEAVIGPISLDNEYPPSVELLTPQEGMTLSGTITLKATAYDPDDNIDRDGVVFFYSSEGDEGLRRIGNDADPKNGEYSINWNTSRVPNGRYSLWAYARDTGKPSTASWHRHNVSIMNPLTVLRIRSIGRSENAWEVEVVMPEAHLAYPLTIRIEVDPGTGFRFSNRIEVGSEPVEAGPFRFRAKIPTNGMPEGNISVRVTVMDRAGASGSFLARDLFWFHPLIRPMVRVLRPLGALKGNASILAEVTDDDIPLSGPVYFSYSGDNRSWALIGKGSFFQGNTYKVIWNTFLVPNGTYFIRANHTDRDGLEAEAFLGGFEVKNEIGPADGPPAAVEKWYETPKGILYVLSAAILVSGLAAAVIALTVGLVKKDLTRRERKRKAAEDRRRQENMVHRARAREKELSRVMTIGSKFEEPVRKPAPRGAVPLKPAEMGIKKKDDIPQETAAAPRIQEFEEPASPQYEYIK